MLCLLIFWEISEEHTGPRWIETFVSARLHGVTSKKIEVLILTTVKSPNLIHIPQLGRLHVEGLLPKFVSRKFIFAAVQCSAVQSLQITCCDAGAIRYSASLFLSVTICCCVKVEAELYTRYSLCHIWAGLDQAVNPRTTNSIHGV